jgi:hypothetical protein
MQFIGVIEIKHHYLHNSKTNFDKFFGFTKKFFAMLNTDRHMKYYR